MGKWMPFAEAVARAGSLKALRPHLFAGRIIARYSRLCFWPGGEVDNTLPTTDIDPSWWADDVAHDIEPEAGRAQFITDLGNQLARGIELERAAVDALWPVKPKPPKHKQSPKQSAVAGAKRGPKQYAVWKPLLKHLDAMVKRGKISNPAEDAFGEAKIWLEKKERSLSDGTLRKGIKRNRPNWF